MIANMDEVITIGSTFDQMNRILIATLTRVIDEYIRFMCKTKSLKLNRSPTVAYAIIKVFSFFAGIATYAASD